MNIMNYGYFFIFSGIFFIFYALNLEGMGLLLLWPGMSFFIVGLAYLRRKSSVYGKRNDGKIRLINKIILFPCFLYTELLWNALRLIRREDPFNELIPGVLIGRRLTGSELPENVEAILDLTAEFSEAHEIMKKRDYYLFPILDGYVPEKKEFMNLIEKINKIKGTLYIHCAEGHGRTGMVAAALLISRGLSENVDEALKKIKEKRPAVTQRRSQYVLVKSLTEELKKLRGV
ncbi:MAG: hypothetical protein BWY64_02782 [bacterium ADurb.Bin363]|nr:MAG: hypothetical protein BWY64_02782 [bacterium ADurb.Bin363]